MATETESNPRPVYGNNTTVTNPFNHPDSDQPRKPHERIETSDKDMKNFNKEYVIKAQSQYMDPCRDQTKASLKCMDENNYNKSKCTRFFKDYADCKRKWLESLREERRKRNLGIVDDDEASPKDGPTPSKA